MNHQKIYNSIIENAKSENRIKLRKNNISYIYYENHHILPRCLGGLNNKENLVLLTAKEHYICHKLLTYIYINEYKIALAFHYMAYNKKYNKYISSRDYLYAKELANIFFSRIPNVWKGRKHSTETKEKMKKSWEKRRIEKPVSDETKRKLSESGKGRIISEETKEKIRNSNKGKILSNETKQKLSISHKGKKGTPHTEEFKKKVSENNKKYKTGVKASDETRLKMSNARKGVKKSEEHKQKIIEGRKRYFERRKLGK
jgi:predicted RND superfamily exporter protein